MRTTTVATMRALILSVAIGATLPARPAQADQTPKIPRIGVLAAPYASAPANEGLSKGLRELDYIEDQNIIIERRSGGTQEELRAATADLVRSKVDVIVVFSTPAARAAMATALPVVFLVGDPVSTGLAATLERPGGNATGIALIYTELITQRLEILQLVAPGARRIGCLMNSSNPASVLQLEAAQHAAHTLGLELVKLDARNDAEVDAVARALSHNALNAILVTGDLVLYANKARLAVAIHDAKLPAIFPSKEWHGDDELMSYAPSISEAGRKMALYIDQILKGAGPADLPIEQLSKYELVIDLRVARAMGLLVPQDLLLRADEVIR